jgi:hypothetical protein
LPTYLKNTKQHQFIITHLNFCSVSFLQGHQCGLNGATRPCPAPESDSSAPSFMSNLSDAGRLLVARGTNARVENCSRILNLGANWFWSKEPSVLCWCSSISDHKQRVVGPLAHVFDWPKYIQSGPYSHTDSFVFASSSLKRRRVVHRTGVCHGRIANCRTAASRQSSREEGAEGLPLQG